MADAAALAKPAPRIDHPADLDRVVRRLVDELHPVAVYLFGSRARGEADEDSDYDLMAVVPDDFPPERTRPSHAFALVEGRKIPVDIALVRRSRFAERSGKVGTLSFEVGRDGIAVWTRTSPTSDLTTSGKTPTPSLPARPASAPQQARSEDGR